MNNLKETIMKRSIILLFCILINIVAFCQTAILPEGEGTQENPYLIASWQNLYWITAPDTAGGLTQSERWSKHYKQTEDIDLTLASPAINTWNNGTGWMPIGDFYNRFMGEYDGNNKSISGLFINRPDSNFQAFIGGTQDNTMIKNLELISVNITGMNWCGGFVGYDEGSGYIQNCSTSGSVTGILGVGGIAGCASSTSISNSSNSAIINGSNRVGGLVGCSIDLTVINLCFNDGIITGESNIGGISGQLFSSYLYDSYSTGQVTGIDKVGGLTGETVYGIITNCYSSANVFGAYDLGGLVGFNDGTIKNSYYDFDSVIINSSHVISIGALPHDLFTAWFPEKSLNIHNYLTSDESTFLINNIDDFKLLLAFGQFEEYHYKLTNDLDFSNEFNFFIPWFSGTFDGDGKKITNLQLLLPYNSCVGLFGYVYHAKIKNFGISNCFISGKSFTGGLSGICSISKLINCFSTGSINNEDRNTGGLTGFAIGDSISFCYSTCSITSEGDCSGGLIGSNLGSTISNSFSQGSVNAAGEYVGGLVGANDGIAINCYSSGNVIGNGEKTGGLMGFNSETVLNSFWDLETSGQTTSASGIGKTTAEMKMISTYTNAGWSFPNPWSMNAYLFQGYPYLNYELIVSNDDNEINTPIVKNVVLHSAYPNPFNPSTTISFDLKSSERVRLDIYNIKGQLIMNVCDNVVEKGNHKIVWDGKDGFGNKCGSGIYFYKITAGETTQTKKMMLIK